MRRYPRIYDKDLRPLGDLRTATVRDLTLRMAPLSHVTLDVPAAELGGFGYRQFVEIFDASGARVDVFRVSEIPKKQYGPAGVVTLECDQALCTLRDDILPGYTQLGGAAQDLRGALEAILAAQRVRRWRLGRCELDGHFEYGFSDEGLLSALLMALEPFTDWMLETDTSTTPWTLHVVRLSDADATELRYSRNLLGVTETVQDEGFATRLYPRGYGEGVNQLNVREVNGGVEYVEAPQAVRDAFGDVSLPFIDTTITDAATLLAKARAELALCQTPQVSYGVSAADLSLLTGEPMDKFTPGRMVRVIYREYGLVLRTRLMELVYPDPIGSPGDVRLTLSSVRETAASVIAGLEKKARISELYGQGSTFIYADTIEQNADADTPAEGDIFIPENMVHVNAVMLKVSVSAFRADSKGAAAGGRTSRTSSAGGASRQTSSAGGGGTQTSSAGGGSRQTSSEGGGSRQTSGAGGGSEQTSSAGGGCTQTSSAGGAGRQTSSDGGGSERTSSAGGGATVSSETKLISSDASQISLRGSNPVGIGGGAMTETGTGGPTRTDSGGGGDTGDGGKHYHMISGHTHSVGSGDSRTGSTSLMTADAGSHSHSTSAHSHGLEQHAHGMNHTHNINGSITVPGFSADVPSHSHGVSIPDHSHSVDIPGHTHDVSIPDHTHSVTVKDHTHDVTIPSHTHSVDIPDHTHDVDIPDHTHSVDIPSHTHEVEIPDHAHAIVYGIYKGPKAAAYAVEVDGARVPDGVFGADGTGDIAPYLSADADGRIRRGVFHSLAIRPLPREGNEQGLCHIRASWNAQVFISSLMGVQR